MLRYAVALFVAAGLSLCPGQALGQVTPNVTVFSPGYYASAETDESIRFSWLAENSQDFFYIYFNESRYYGWETSTRYSRQTFLSSIYLTPEEVGLNPGSWYWRVCFGWYENPSTCYFDDDIRTLDVEQPEPFLRLSTARSVARRYARRRWGVRTRATCLRISDSEATCRVSWRKRGRLRRRYLDLELRSDGYVYIS